MRLSELLKREVVTESGLSHGKVHDIRGELGSGRLLVTGLACGPMGVLERYGVGTGGTGGPAQAKVHGHAAIPWARVLRVGTKLVIRD
jgi:sporulation protein YlmC with PRC-barrel domain